MDPEIAIGAVAQDGTIILNDRHLEVIPVDIDYMVREAERQVKEVKRLSMVLRGDKSFPMITGENVILVDDGVATGFTLKAVLYGIKKNHPASITLVIPVAPKELMSELEREVDKVVCIANPSSFWSVGQFYEEFDQVNDEQVMEALKYAKSCIRGNLTGNIIDPGFNSRDNR